MQLAFYDSAKIYLQSLLGLLFHAVVAEQQAQLWLRAIGEGFYDKDCDSLSMTNCGCYSSQRRLHSMTRQNFICKVSWFNPFMQ